LPTLQTAEAATVVFYPEKEMEGVAEAVALFLNSICNFLQFAVSSEPFELPGEVTSRLGWHDSLSGSAVLEASSTYMAVLSMAKANST
jgi:hypothetical protein